MKHIIEHDLDMKRLRKATQKAMDAYSERFAKYNPQARWIDDDNAVISFSAKSVELEGNLALRPEEIELQLDVPFVFRVFRKKAIDIIDSEIKTWLEKARQGELDDDDE